MHAYEQKTVKRGLLYNRTQQKILGERRLFYNPLLKTDLRKWIWEFFHFKAPTPIMKWTSEKSFLLCSIIFFTQFLVKVHKYHININSD